MIHGYHVIWGTYGFWLPNDPRGSWSDFVYAWELARHGPATRSIERVDVDPEKYARWLAKARAALKYPPVTLTDEQMLDVARAIGGFVERNLIGVWACSILPQHVHLVLPRQRYRVEQLANLLKGAAQRELIKHQRHPLVGFQTTSGRVPSVWADKRWKVFLDSEAAIENAIRYVEENPVKEGRPRQEWSFVQPFEGLDQAGWITYP